MDLLKEHKKGTKLPDPHHRRPFLQNLRDRTQPSRWRGVSDVLSTLALPQEVEHWSLTTLREKLVKIGARIVRHGRYVVFQLAEVAVPRSLFADILRRIHDLRPRPPPLPA
jgi:hypothetical protein